LEAVISQREPSWETRRCGWWAGLACPCTPRILDGGSRRGCLGRILDAAAAFCGHNLGEVRH
jgi:hypothetical protein